MMYVWGMKAKTAKKKSNWGGARPNSGPKPKEANQLKKAICLYVTGEALLRIGGEDEYKKKCYGLLK